MTGGGVEQAMEWLLAHSEDPGINDPPAEPARAAAVGEYTVNKNFFSLAMGFKQVPTFNDTWPIHFSNVLRRRMKLLLGQLRYELHGTN